ncbi:unnamed protein product [Owenia fusiformis]|uniref:Fatty acyl-CoA reductase n=1 Tax=Owenia fusiformis TaxID=6347 RepID=A0A8J1TYQ7_OWEFU|nr:unnamed protein product [Owenia fusiformis]
MAAIDGSPISDFYVGRSIFITGGTGFMGKVLIEKLIRSCPGVKTIYVLIRPRKGQDAQQRLDNLLKTKLFDAVRKTNPDFHSHLLPIDGDMLEENLGISDHDVHILQNEVSIVFHSAATVKFDEQLKLSVQMNVLGVQKIIELCQKLTKLEALVHVSTAYANCDRQHIAELVYPPPLQPQKILDAMDWMDDEVVTTLTPKLIGNRPNTYTYTKAMAEYLLVETCGELPVAIIRPSIVGCSFQEPMPGWVDNFNGPAGIIAAIGKGVLRSMLGDHDKTADLIPVDMAVNCMIAVAWQRATTNPSNVPVYNCTTGQINRMTWGTMERLSFNSLMNNPLDGIVRVPNPRFTKSWLKRDFCLFFDHYLPALLLDSWLFISGRKPVFRKVNDKIIKASASLEFFTTNEWEFCNDNICALQAKLSKTDRTTFSFDVKRINWPLYMENYCLGVKKFALKEQLSNLPAARKALNRLKKLTMAFNFIIAILIWRFGLTRLTVVRNLWQFLLKLATSFLTRIPGFAKSS